MRDIRDGQPPASGARRSQIVPASGVVYRRWRMAWPIATVFELKLPCFPFGERKSIAGVTHNRHVIRSANPGG